MSGQTNWLSPGDSIRHSSERLHFSLLSQDWAGLSLPKIRSQDKPPRSCYWDSLHHPSSFLKLGAALCGSGTDTEQNGRSPGKDGPETGSTWAGRPP